LTGQGTPGLKADPDNPQDEFSLSSSEKERVGVRRLFSVPNPLAPALSPSDEEREKRVILIGSTPP
jgi:hypothetical protein